MSTRRFLSILLAVAFVTLAAIAPVHADGTPPGGSTGDNSIHPWDINDGSVDPGTGTVDQQAPSLSVVVIYPDWFGNIVGTAAWLQTVTRTLTPVVRTTAPTLINRPVTTQPRVRSVRR